MKQPYTIITGALGGLGSTFAYECSSRGTNLILVDRLANGEDLVGYLKDQFPINAEYYICDLSDLQARSSLFDKLDKDGLHFNGLVNVVGQEIEGKFLTRTRDEIFTMLHLNIEAMMDLCLFALSRHNPNHKFLLVNVASLAGFFPLPHKAVYSASKRFIIQFSLALREEIRDFGNVTVLCPGGLPTNPEAMKKIFLQGFWGKLTAHDTHEVVKRTLEKVGRNVPIYTPGIPNRFLAWLGGVLPANWVAGYSARRWGKKQSRLDYWRMMNKSQEN